MCSRDGFDLVVSAGKWIEKHEGRRTRVYHDTAGHPTIGIGFNLDRADTGLALLRVGAYREALVAGHADLSEAQVDGLFARDLADSIEDARDLCVTFDELHSGAQIALTDMAFNLGRKGLSRFRSMLSALSHGAWNLAAAEALDSDWARQVGQRALDDAALIRGDMTPAGAKGATT